MLPKLERKKKILAKTSRHLPPPDRTDSPVTNAGKWDKSSLPPG